MKLIVDRIEGDIASCEMSDGKIINLPLSELPVEVREGSVIEIKGKTVVLSEIEESEKRTKNYQRLNKLFSKNHLQ